MPVMSRTQKFWALTLAIVAAAVLGIGAEALAQANPFGTGPGPAPARPPALDGIAGFILAKQAEFYRALGAMIRAAKADGSASVGLLGLSFAYGIFHAAGPGHGKAVISSYLVANEETWRRGIVLSFASALLQSLVAVAIVGVAAALLQATAKAMCDTGRIIEMVGYALIIAVGARLLFVKGRGFFGALRTVRHGPAPAPVGAAVTPQHDHHHDHAHEHPHDSHGHHGHIGHAEGEHCGHTHGPALEDLAGPGGWRRGLSAILAVGLRPCSGAILVLVFALAQGLFWVGVASTFAMGLGTAITVAAIATLAVGARAVAVRLASGRSGFGTLAIRGIEVAAAALIIAFGSLLLAGYMINERLVGLCG
jgi:nickel/cobalt transporter (NicO) family protein